MSRATQLVKTRTRHEVRPPWGDEEKETDLYTDIQTAVRGAHGEGGETSPPPLPLPSPAGPVCPGILLKGPTQRQARGCLCFQMWPAEGTRTTAQLQQLSGCPGSGFRAWGPWGTEHRHPHIHTSKWGALVVGHRMAELPVQLPCGMGLTEACLDRQKISRPSQNQARP